MMRFRLDHRTSQTILLAVEADYEALTAKLRCGIPATEQRTGIEASDAQVPGIQALPRNRLGRSSKLQHRTSGSFNQWLAITTRHVTGTRKSFPARRRGGGRSSCA